MNAGNVRQFKTTCTRSPLPVSLKIRTPSHEFVDQTGTRTESNKSPAAGLKIRIGQTLHQSPDLSPDLSPEPSPR